MPFLASSSLRRCQKQPLIRIRGREGTEGQAEEQASKRLNLVVVRLDRSCDGRWDHGDRGMAMAAEKKRRHYTLIKVAGGKTDAHAVAGRGGDHIKC